MEQLRNGSRLTTENRSDDAARWAVVNKLKSAICEGGRACNRAEKLNSADTSLLYLMVDKGRLLADGSFICVHSVMELAEILGYNVKSIPRILRRCADRGWLVSRTGPNGFRGHLNGHYFGIDLSPMLTNEKKEVLEAARRSATVDARDHSLGRRDLRIAKQALCDALTNAKNVASDVSLHAHRIMRSIPQRFTFSLDEIRALIVKIYAAASELALAKETAHVTEERHERHQDELPNTYSSNIYKSNTTSNSQLSKSDSDPSAIGLARKCAEIKKEPTKEQTLPTVKDAMKLLTDEERSMIESEYNPQTTQELVNAFEQVALYRWHMACGEEAVLPVVFRNLGQFNASMLLVLVTDRAASPFLPRIHNIGRYALRCVSMAASGEFNWNGGVKSAARRVRPC